MAWQIHVQQLYFECLFLQDRKDFTILRLSLNCSGGKADKGNGNGKVWKGKDRIQGQTVTLSLFVCDLWHTKQTLISHTVLSLISQPDVLSDK